MSNGFRLNGVMFVLIMGLLQFWPCQFMQDAVRFQQQYGYVAGW